MGFPLQNEILVVVYPSSEMPAPSLLPHLLIDKPNRECHEKRVGV